MDTAAEHIPLFVDLIIDGAGTSNETHSVLSQMLVNLYYADVTYYFNCTKFISVLYA